MDNCKLVMQDQKSLGNCVSNLRHLCLFILYSMVWIKKHDFGYICYADMSSCWCRFCPIMNAGVEGFRFVRLNLRQEKGGSLVVSRPILERGRWGLNWYASIVAFCCSDCCIIVISCTVGSTMFGGEPCAVSVVGAEYVDIDEVWELIVWGFVLLVWTDIVILISWSGWGMSTPLLVIMECKRVYGNQLRANCWQMSWVLIKSWSSSECWVLGRLTTRHEGRRCRIWTPVQAWDRLESWGWCAASSWRQSRLGRGIMADMWWR